MSNLREVVHSPRFDAELEDVERDPRQADQVLHAVTWALARHPDRGFAIPGMQFSIWPVYIKQREYVVYYPGRATGAPPLRRRDTSLSPP